MITLFRVGVLRTEYIEFDLEAASAEDAMDRYLTDGDEVGSETCSTTVEEVVPLEPQ